MSDFKTPLTPQSLPLASKVPYFKTGKSSPDVWIERTVSVLKQLGATNITEAFCSYEGRGGYVLQFSIGDERFRVSWPTLPVKNEKDSAAARTQAATLLYHDCKAKALAASVLGPRSAFIGNLLLEHGKTVLESAMPELLENVRPLALLST